MNVFLTPASSEKLRGRFHLVFPVMPDKAAFERITLITACVPVAQWLEHCVSSGKVVGSIPREHTY